MNHVTLAGLPVTNLRRKPFRTTALVIVVIMLTVAFTEAPAVDEP